MERQRPKRGGASFALNLAKANPRLRPLHLVVRETEFCGLRLAGYFRRRMRENSRNSVRRPTTAASQTVLKYLPQGMTPPFVLSFNASSVAVIQLALSSKSLSHAAPH